MTDTQQDLALFGGPGTMHIDHAAAVTARMPTPREIRRGFPADAPVLVIDRGHHGELVLPHYITVTFDGPHGTPEPDAARDAAVYVLGIIGERLGNLHADLDDLTGALSRSPCGVVDLAGKVHREQAAGPPSPQ